MWSPFVHSQFKGQDAEFVPTKLMTRLTYTLDEVRVQTSATAEACPLAPLEQDKEPAACTRENLHAKNVTPRFLFPPHRCLVSSRWTAAAMSS